MESEISKRRRRRRQCAAWNIVKHRDPLLLVELGLCSSVGSRVLLGPSSQSARIHVVPMDDLSDIYRVGGPRSRSHLWTSAKGGAGRNVD